jgi:hypothetical protein
MANKSDHEFGKRKPVSAPASSRSGPPAKRSGHVALLLMGTFAVGSAAYTLMPSRNCEQPPNAASPGSTECTSRSSSSSSHSGSGGSSSRSSYYSSDSSSSHSSGTSDSGSHSAQRGGFGSFGHAVGFSGG